MSLALLKPDVHITTSGYLKHFLESFSGKLELDKRTLHHAVPLKINLGDIGKIGVRIPSLKKQAEIVEVLDLFSGLTTSTKGGLGTEIALRNKQFEYYRRNLLTFDVSGGK